MKFIINDHRKLHAIQEEFSTLFPNLGLTFYARPHNQKSGDSDKTILEGSKTLGECRLLHNKGTLTITPGMSAPDLEDDFRSIYGLSVEVKTKHSSESIAKEKRAKMTLLELNESLEPA